MPSFSFGIFVFFFFVFQIVSEFFEKEFDRHEEPPDELLKMQSLKDRVRYACRMFNAEAGDSCTQLGQNKAKRKRSNVSAQQTDTDSEFSVDLSPQATNVQDLPGYMRPPLKRRKIYDPSLIISGKNETEFHCLDDTETDKPKATPMKLTAYQDPTCSKYLRSSASKVAIPAKKLSELILNHNYEDVIAESINNALKNDNVSFEQLHDRLGGIIAPMEENPTFDEMLQELCQSTLEDQSRHSSPSSELEYDPANEQAIDNNDRQLDTPVPNNNVNKSNRYELRSRKNSNSMLNTSTESKRQKNNSKVHIISDERINVPADAIQAIPNEPILVASDSEEIVTTTSQQQQQSQQQIVYGQLHFDPQTQRIVLIPVGVNPIDNQFQPSTSIAINREVIMVHNAED